MAIYGNKYLVNLISLLLSTATLEVTISPAVAGNITRELSGSFAVCMPGDHNHNHNHRCCSGRILPENHFLFKCLDNKPYKKIKTETRCDHKTRLVSKYSQKFGCCRHYRFKRSRAHCHHGNIFKPLKIPCPKGYQPNTVPVFSVGTKLSFTCEKCPPGFFSSHFGFGDCVECSRCEFVSVQCTPSQDSVCSKAPTPNCTDTGCKGYRSIGRKKSRGKVRRNHKKRRNRKKGGRKRGKSRTYHKRKRLRHKIKLHREHSKEANVTVGALLNGTSSSSDHWTSGAWSRTPVTVPARSRVPLRVGIDISSLLTLEWSPRTSTTADGGGIDFKEEERSRVSHVLSITVIGTVTSLIVSGVLIVLTVVGCKRMRARKTTSYGVDLEIGELGTPSNKKYTGQLSEYDGFLTYSDDEMLFHNGTACAPPIVMATQRALTRHRRSYSDGDAVLAKSDNKLSLLSKTSASLDGLNCRRRSCKRTDINSADSCSMKQNLSESYCSPVDSTKHLYADFYKTVQPVNQCLMGSLDDVFSLASFKNEALKFPTFLSSLFIKQIEKSAPVSDINNSDSLRKDMYTQTSLKRTNQRNMLGEDWDRGGSFDQNGGILEKSGSDVSLIIPQGAVGSGMVAKIHGKVFTNVDRFSSIFDLRGKERFVSPIVEFVESRHYQFQSHVVVKIPVCRGSSADSSFRVLFVQGVGTAAVTSVPRHDKLLGPRPDVYYEVREEGFVEVHTKHFTTFACSSCDNAQIKLEGLVFGRTIHVTGLPPETDIRLFACDSFHLIKDFRTALELRESKLRWQLLDAKTVQLHDAAQEDDWLSMSLDVSERSSLYWKLKLRKDGSAIFDGPNVKKQFSQLVRCQPQLEFPDIAGEWAFESEDLPNFFDCVLDVEHEPLALVKEQRRRTTFSIIVETADAKMTTSCSPAIEKMKAEALCSCLASELMSVKRFAREMGVPDVTIDAIFVDFAGDHRECKYRVVYACLSRHGHTQFLKKLPQVLKGIGQMDMVHKFFPQFVPKTENDVDVSLTETPHNTSSRIQTVV